MDGNDSSGQTELSGTARERFERVAARLAGEAWGGRWIPVPLGEFVDAGEDDLAASA